MKYKAILFDLDGTLMPMDNDDFEKLYLSTLGQKLAPYIEPRALMHSMMDALQVMMRDSSNITNDQIFFSHFKSLLGDELASVLEPKFDEYYRNEFSILQSGFDDNSKMVKTIEYLKSRGYRLIVATNPMFPPIAVEKRIEFSGLNLEDFDFVSNFEIHTATKPQKRYFEEVLRLNNLEARDCLMIGNDMEEDMVAKELGMDGWIITDYLISRNNNDVSDWSGSREEFYQRVKEKL